MPIQKLPSAMRCAATDIDRPGADCGPGSAQPRGFTLIELLIVLAIIAILAAIAYPSYTNFILKGKRAEGRAALVNLLQQEEANITQKGSYTLFAAGATGTAFRTYSNDDANSATAAYLLGAQNCPSPASQVANPTDCVQVFTVANNIVDPVVTQLNITSNGTKDCTVTGSDKSLCWP